MVFAEILGIVWQANGSAGLGAYAMAYPQRGPQYTGVTILVIFRCD